MATTLTRRKPIDDSIQGTEEEGYRLKKDLTAKDVVIFGIGVMIGAGIFVLTGQAAATEAGPAITLSYVLAGIAAFLAAICYAEFAAMVPVAGSAYTFSYATLGELLAFIIGWDLILEFTLGAATVAVGFGGYLNALLDTAFGVSLPASITAPPGSGGGVFNVTAVVLVLVVIFLLVRGIRISSRFNIVMVVITLAAILTVIVVGATQVDPANWTPYFPFGFEGIASGAALIFFAYIGFDVVATTAEETQRPQRDMPLGIIGSLAIVTVLYMAVAAILTGMAPFEELGSEVPVADAFAGLDLPTVASIVYIGALVATANTVLILMLGQTRVGFAMARDRLLPKLLGRTHERFGTPHRLTIVVGLLVALLAGLVPIKTLAELVNIGTLFAFILVAAGIWYLRRADPGRERPFRTPLVPLVPILLHRRVRLSDLQPPERRYLPALPRLDGHRPGPLFRIQPAQEPGGRGRPADEATGGAG